MLPIIFWDDGTWCYGNDYNPDEYYWKADRHFKIDVDETYGPHDIQEYIDYLTEKL